MSHLVVDLKPLEQADYSISLRDLTREEYLAFCEANPNFRIERSATGEVIVMPPAHSRTSAQNFEIVKQLANWAEQDGRGFGFGPDSGYDLPNGANRGPDASWVLKSRLATLTKAQKDAFLPLCPDFAIGLRSGSDRLPTLREKMLEYIENGSRLAWLIDPKSRKVYVYRPGAEEDVLDNPQSVSADPELPGFRLDLARVWDPGF